VAGSQASGVGPRGSPVFHLPYAAQATSDSLVFLSWYMDLLVNEQINHYKVLEAYRHN